MKHPVAVAMMNGMSLALGEEVNNGSISMQNASQALRFGLAISNELLKGNKPFGKELQDFAEDGEHIEDLLTANKVNLQRFGDV